jgi:hypothetical protein
MKLALISVTSLPGLPDTALPDKSVVEAPLIFPLESVKLQLKRKYAVASSLQENSFEIDLNFGHGDD